MTKTKWTRLLELRGSVAFAETILPPDTRVVNYLLDYAQPDAIQWLLDNGFIKKNKDASAFAILTLARTGNLDLMKQVDKLHSRKRLNKDWIDKWDWAMDSASERGDLAMVKWMAEDRAGRAVLARIKDDSVFNICKMLDSAAKAGHIDVLQYLFEHGWPDEDADTLLNAAAGGQLDCVKWLLDNAPPYSQDNNADGAVVSAARNGHLEMLQFFHELHLNESAQPKHVNDHYPTLLTLEFGRGTKSDLRYENARGGDHLIAQLLDPKYPGHPTERHQANHDLKHSTS
ncbi:hypothetical protein PRNP1_008080 [Phytophthora ramorum]